jgi:hypothetical protein
VNIFLQLLANCQIVKKFQTLLFATMCKIKKIKKKQEKGKKRKKKKIVKKIKIKWKKTHPKKGRETPTSSCACAHTRELPYGNVISGQNTRKKGGNPQLAGAYPRIRGNPFGVTSLPVALSVMRTFCITTIVQNVQVVHVNAITATEIKARNPPSNFRLRMRAPEGTPSVTSHRDFW